MTTIVMVSCGPRGCATGAAWNEVFEELAFAYAGCDTGRKFSATTAFGITETIKGSSDALRTVFSLLLDISSET